MKSRFQSKIQITWKNASGIVWTISNLIDIFSGLGRKTLFNSRRCFDKKIYLNYDMEKYEVNWSENITI